MEQHGWAAGHFVGPGAVDHGQNSAQHATRVGLAALAHPGCGRSDTVVHWVGHPHDQPNGNDCDLNVDIVQGPVGTTPGIGHWSDALQVDPDAI
jgi:hypothetical protein